MVKEEITRNIPNTIEIVKHKTFDVSPENLINTIITKEDFCLINGKVEPTRNLALKLFTATKIESYEVVLQQVIEREKELIYICKATLARKGKVADGLGACSTLEVSAKGGKTRQHHDALAIAETRAYKRAVEAVVGLPFINDIILRLFGKYETEEIVETKISSEEFMKKIGEAKAMPHLWNIWKKYKHNLKDYTPKEQDDVITCKNNRKEELRNEYRENHRYVS